MKISLDDGTIYYEDGVVIKRGMSSREVMQQLGRFYPNPETACIGRRAWFPVLPTVYEGLRLKVDVRNELIQEIELVVPRIKFPKSKEAQIEHLKLGIGEKTFEFLANHENICEFSWGTIRLFWNGRDEEMTIEICYR